MSRYSGYSLARRYVLNVLLLCNVVVFVGHRVSFWTGLQISAILAVRACKWLVQFVDLVILCLEYLVFLFELFLALIILVLNDLHLFMEVDFAMLSREPFLTALVSVGTCFQLYLLVFLLQRIHNSIVLSQIFISRCLFVTKLYDEYKVATVSVIRFTNDVTIEHVRDFFWNVQP